MLCSFDLMSLYKLNVFVTCMNTAPAMDCWELYQTGIRTSGVYTIYPWNDNRCKEVLCNMDLYPGGWTVFVFFCDWSFQLFTCSVRVREMVWFWTKCDYRLYRQDFGKMGLTSIEHGKNTKTDSEVSIPITG